MAFFLLIPPFGNLFIRIISILMDSGRRHNNAFLLDFFFDGDPS